MSSAVLRAFPLAAPDNAWPLRIVGSSAENPPSLPSINPKIPQSVTAPTIHQFPRIAGVLPASLLGERPAPAMAATGIEEIDALTGGLPRGALTEIYGPASSGRTSLLLSALAQSTQRQEVCALVDVSDAFHPRSAAAAGVNLKRLLWVRCSPSRQNRPTPRGHRGPEKLRIDDCGLQTASGSRGLKSAICNQGSALPSSASPRLRGENALTVPQFRALEQALKVTDLLLQGGGFGLVAVDLGDIPPPIARRIPLTSWFRFRRVVENTPAVLLVIEQEPYARTCASLVLRMQTQHSAFRTPPSAKETNGAAPAHARLLRGISVTAEILRSRMERKPVRSVTAAYETRAEWG